MKNHGESLIQRQLREYRQKRDAHFRSWIRDRCYHDDFVETVIADLRANYAAWCALTRVRQQSHFHWGVFMRKHYVRLHRYRGKWVRVYAGVGLKPTADSTVQFYVRAAN